MTVASGFDTRGSDGWLEVYSTTRAFPDDPEASLTATGTYVDVAQLDELDTAGQQGAPGTVSGPFPVPTARDIRIELRVLCRDDPTYFADDRARLSHPVTVDLHQKAAVEKRLFRPADPTRSASWR